jgi:hypothetical protein
MCYPHHVSITIENQHNMRLLGLNNMMMKRLVGGGDDWHVHMDGTNHHIDNLLGSKKRSGQKDYD